MLKKTITFNDLDGNSLTEDFYFNLTKAEIAEMELSQKGGLSEHLKAIIASEDGKAIISTFKEIISMAVGRRSEDGRKFEKSQDITNNFLQTEAYSEMFMELVTNAKAASAFIVAIIPSDMSEGLEKAIASEEQPAWIRENREPTPQELTNMSQEQLMAAFQAKQARVETVTAPTLTDTDTPT